MLTACLNFARARVIGAWDWVVNKTDQKYHKSKGIFIFVGTILLKFWRLLNAPNLILYTQSSFLQLGRCIIEAQNNEFYFENINNIIILPVKNRVTLVTASGLVFKIVIIYSLKPHLLKKVVSHLSRYSVCEQYESITAISPHSDLPPLTLIFNIILK